MRTGLKKKKKKTELSNSSYLHSQHLNAESEEIKRKVFFLNVAYLYYILIAVVNILILFLNFMQRHTSAPYHWETAHQTCLCWYLRANESISCQRLLYVHLMIHIAWIKCKKKYIYFFFFCRVLVLPSSPSWMLKSSAFCTAQPSVRASTWTELPSLIIQGRQFAQHLSQAGGLLRSSVEEELWT